MALSKQSNKAVQTRCVTICGKGFKRMSVERCVYFPIISLSGKWLCESGFKIGHIVDIVCEDGRLTITLSKEQRYVDI